jgi:hypothetical protein
MPMTIVLETEDHSVVEQVLDVHNVILTLAGGQPGLRAISSVDPYGDTVFNHLQIPAVIEDLHRLAGHATNESEREILANVEQLARKSGQHLYMTFQGD